MNIKMVFANKIESYDTKADGKATTTRAVIEVDGRILKLSSVLKFDHQYDRHGLPVGEQTKECGTAEVIAKIETPGLSTLPEFLDALGEEQGLLRFDVDGEAIWTAAPDLEVDGGGEEYDDPPRGLDGLIMAEMAEPSRNPMLDYIDEDEDDDE